MSTAEILPYQAPSEIAALVECSRLLAQARNLEDLVNVRDFAETIRKCARVRRHCLEIQNDAAEIKIRAERRAGRLLADTVSRGNPQLSHDDTIRTSLAEVGVNRSQSSRWQQIAKLPEADFEEHIRETKESGKELTSSGTLKKAKQYLAQQPAETTEEIASGESGIVRSLSELIDAGKKFSTIYADPPWQYENQRTRASTDNHYGTMTVEEICAEPVSQLLHPNAHLHLWTTNAFLPAAFKVIEAWGFEYKSCFVWVKPQMGIGNYWRVSHEFLLLGVRGRFPFLVKDEMIWAAFDREGHSAKPDDIRQKVERVSPGPYLEMYGRLSLPSTPWTVYGNQIDKRLI